MERTAGLRTIVSALHDHFVHLSVWYANMKSRVLGALVLSLMMLPAAARAQSDLTNQHLFDTIPFLPEHYDHRVQQFQQQPVVAGRIMFLGDSITEMGKWSQLLGDTTVINRGIGGDITYGVIKRLDDVVRRRPSKLFIMIGINDIGKDIPDEVIAGNVRQIIQRVQAQSPSTKIYLQSILPVNADYPHFPQHYAKGVHVVHTNSLLRIVADAMHVPYVDLFSHLLDPQQRMDTKYALDGLHINQSGYDVWVSYLKKLGYL